MTLLDHVSLPPLHPLAYVVLELRVPFSPRLVSQASVEQLVAKLDDLPVLREEARHTMTPTSDGGIEVRPTSGWRMMDLEGTRSLILTSTSLTYESTRYAGFEQFCIDVERWLEAVESVCAPVGYDRLGLRYVNEVRPVRRHAEFDDWAQVMSPSYIHALTEAQESVRGACRATADAASPTADPMPEDADDSREELASNCLLVSAETNMSFLLPDNAGMTLKLGNGEGTGVIGNAPLKRYQLPEAGPFFVVDFDGFWPAKGTDIKPFNRHDILLQMSKVHEPVKSTFRWATTSDYRKAAGVIND